MNRSTKLYGGLVVIVICALIALIWWPRVANECVRQKTEPDLSPTTPAMILLSADGLVMGSILGYITILNDNTYLPLEFETISHQTSAAFRVVTLTGKCVVMHIKYSFQDLNQYQYLGLEMLIKNDTLKDKTPRKICDFDKRFEFFQPAEFRFSCNSTKSHACSVREQISSGHQSARQVASVMLRSFELEIDGYKIRKVREFWKKLPWNLSCETWDG